MEYIFGITILLAVILYISWRIAEDEQRKFDHELELKQSAKREKERSAFPSKLTDQEMMDVAREVERRMERR